MNSANDIQSCFEAKLSDLIPDKQLTFNVHLFFKQNHRIIILGRKGDILTKTILQRYASRGIDRIWILHEDREAYEEYLNLEVQAKPAIPSTPATPTLNKEESAEKMIELFKSGVPRSGNSPENEKKRSALIAKNARSVLSDTVKTNDLPSQEKAHSAARSIVKKMLNSTQLKTSSLLNELWETAETTLEFTHAPNVATYSVLITLSMGKSDPELVADLALAGLLHDIGLSQVSPKITSLPWKSFTDEMEKDYSAHVEAGIQIIDAFGADIPERVKTWILQHHEKFNGTGYPQRLLGPKMDLPPQFLALAEFLDTIASGQFDGIKRTYRESLNFIDELQSSRKLTGYCNPEILSAILKWTHDHSSKDIEKALQTVESQKSKIVQKKP